MSKNSWILWALVLMLPGGAGLGYHIAQKNAINDQVSAGLKVTSENPTTEEYLQKYEAWSQLSTDEKLENSWGQGEYGGPEIQNRLRENQIHQLWADLPDLNKGLKHYPEHLAESLYGQGWQEQLEDYRQKCEVADMTLIGSVLVISSGGLIFLGGLIKTIVVLVLKKNKKQIEDESTEQAQDQSSEAIIEKEEDTADNPEANDLTESEGDTPEESGVDKNNPGYFGSKKTTTEQTTDITDISQAAPAEELSELTASMSAASVDEKPTKDAYFGWAVDGEGGAELDTMMTTEPLTKELNGLSEEMSAIREFAAQQQDQVRKLQDGYDWMIVRRFCMRIIRCVDNIEDRYNRLDDPDSEVAMSLEDIRDELVFALESSGVEQFKPDLESPFKGLEKYAEAVRGRVETNDAELAGTIARIVRPGYQYLISEDDVKIVRCAQVQLYEANQSE